MKSAQMLLLDAIERQEMLSLVWGYVDGSISRDDAMALAKSLVSDLDEAEEVLEELFSQGLVFELKGQRIRSRFAETIRLLVRLRQLFPGKPWQGSPRLVSDFHVDLRKRHYPRRDRNAADLLIEHSIVLNSTSFRRALWLAITDESKLTLASFQERALLRLLTTSPDTGTIVTAGTGSGKTLAFYLPAFLRICDHIKPNQYWVKALAIYPRTELLKDQLSETFRRARQADHSLQQNGRRPMLLGAYFGSTPEMVSSDAIQKRKWRRYSGGFVCPWFTCPSCGNELGWTDADINSKREKLVCTAMNCGLTIGSDQLVLTRTRLSTEPPDILFTTTEMLNQRMSDLRMRGLFGIGQPQNRKPLFTLLDEVHTYVGTSGAQAALVLRRWRYLVDSPVTWCGLSATLREAPRFFSELTGVLADRISEITPSSEEMVSEGAEYQVVVRGDPTLQASLLSTSIQSAMLIGRMMDPNFGSPSKGVFGRRLFVFTDDLDVTHRLFDNLRDAEAYTIYGKIDSSRNPLAFLRGNGSTDDRLEADGQRWWACERLGRQLSTRLVVGRTTAKDAGVLSNADVIVATSALEVGYNDEEVGCVLQHKSPHNMASFLQRKGRAGRTRGMRPMTVTTLSDYGRDRVSFQAYEHLFDPTLPPQHLPIQNQYVLRMQAVFAFIDWLAEECAQGNQSGWLWDLLSKPSNYSLPVQEQIKKKLTAIIRRDQPTLASLHTYLQKSLKLSIEVVDSIMWDPPRALLLEVIPTLVRRFFLGWKLAYPVVGKEFDFQVDYHPLPDFIPSNLFSDLCLPEVQITLPPASINSDSKQDALPIVQALQQLAPGRVTRRFASERGGLSHWFEIEPISGIQLLKIDQYAEHNESLGVFDGYRGNGEKCSLSVYRPWSVHLTKVPQSILPSSNAFPIWFSGFSPRGTPLVVGVPARSVWFEHVSDVHFYLHKFRSSIGVRRFSPEVLATVRQSHGESHVSVRYVDSAGLPAAVGFEIEVDGFYVDFRLPPIAELASLKLSPELNSSCHLAYHRYRVLSDLGLPSEVNSLQRDWIHQILISASIVRALKDNISIGEAAIVILSNNPERTFAEVMKSLFVVQDVEFADEDELDDELEEMEVESKKGARRISRLEEKLTETLARQEVIERLKVLSPELDAPDSEAYSEWISHTLYETLSEALLQACINTAPRHAATDTLVSDFEINIEEGFGRVWITETTLGGAGVIQAFAEAFSNDPRALFRALEAALAPTDIELSSYGLKRYLALVSEIAEVRDLTAKLRQTVDHSIRNSLRVQLYEMLTQRGLDISHALSVSINTRILKPGMGPEWDKLLLDLVSEWEQLELKFSLAIGVREFCYVALNLSGFRKRLTDLIGIVNANATGEAELIQVLGGLLWPRGMEIRQRALQSYNPFRTRRVTDPLLVRKLLLEPNIPEVYIEKQDWVQVYEKILAVHGTVQLKAQRGNNNLLHSAIIEALCRPIDVGYLQFFPVVERIERGETETQVTLSLREQV